MKTETKAIIKRLNPWWNQKQIDIGIKREKYQKKIIQALEGKRMTLLLGSRRVGKTYLIFQTIYKLIKTKKISPKKILFLSLDNPLLSELDLLNYITNFDYVFLDEIQYLDNWQQILKAVYDFPGNKSKILCSGSSSAVIQDKKSFLTGRVKMITVYSLGLNKFYEFSKTRNYKCNLLSYLEYGGYPEYVLERHPTYHNELLNNIISKDIVDQFSIRLVQPFRELLRLLATRVGFKTSKNKLANVLGITDDTVGVYLEYLAKSHLISYIYKYSLSLNDQIYSPKKYYFKDLGMRNSLVGFGDLGSLAENAVFIKLEKSVREEKKELFYCSASSGSEIDFLIKKGNQAELVEVKFKRYFESLKQGLSNEFFKSKYKLKIVKRIVVTHGFNKKVNIKGKKIIFISLEKFLKSYV